MRQAGDGAAHGQQGGLQDVDPLDFGHRGGADADLDAAGGAGGEQGGEGELALGGGKFLRIVKQGAEGGGDAAGQHHGGGEHRAGERAAPDFVDAGDPAVGICDARHGADCTSARPESRGRFFTRGRMGSMAGSV